MSFNNSKFKQIISRKKSQHVASALSLGGQVLKKSIIYYKYLSFCSSADLSWSYHIKCICTKARKIMGILLYSVFNASNVDSPMKRLYTSLVRLHLEQEFIKRFPAEIIKMQGWEMKLLAKKVHIYTRNGDITG